MVKRIIMKEKNDKKTHNVYGRERKHKMLQISRNLNTTDFLKQVLLKH